MLVPPTKCTLFFYNPDETIDNQIQEIKTKGTCTKVLADYGIKEGSVIVLKQTMDGAIEPNTMDSIQKALGLTTMSKVTFDDTYFPSNDSG
jgi:hypothetical protein